MDNDSSIWKNEVLQLKVMSGAQVCPGILFATKRKINNSSSASSALGGVRIESDFTPTKKTNVQTC